MVSPEECAASSSLSGQHVQCILTYEGSPMDIIINYALLALNLVAAILTLIAVEQRTMTAPNGRESSNNSKARIAIAEVAFLFVCAFQVGLCMVVRCYGISIIWCALLGWIAPFRRVLQEGNEQTATTPSSSPKTESSSAPLINREEKKEEREAFCSPSASSPPSVPSSVGVSTSTALFFSCAAIVYYAAVSEMITTVAHVLAIAMGSTIATGTIGTFPYHRRVVATATTVPPDHPPTSTTTTTTEKETTQEKKKISHEQTKNKGHG